jgi:hypothetical protein
LDRLGEILRTERDWYDENEMSQAVQPWRDAWAKQAQLLREEDERLQPFRAHQQAGREWYSAWERILRCCHDCTGLKHLAPEIQRQSQEFTDLLDVTEAMQRLWSDRWKELSETMVAKHTAEEST